MGIVDAIATLEQQVSRPSDGLPDDLFYYVSKITPLVNVDLLIKDENERVLLSWRNDQYCGKGWHVPGGIIRFKETMEERVRKVAETELGTTVSFDRKPLAVNQCIHHDRDIRGHFISILFKCFLSEKFIPENIGLSINDGGYLMWHEACPDNLLDFHEMYRDYINRS